MNMRPPPGNRSARPLTPRAILFDVDGLLVDTEELYYGTFNETLVAHGAGLAREGYAPYVGHPVEDNSRSAVAQYALRLSPEAFCREWMGRFEDTLSDPARIHLMPGVLELLSYVRGKGYRLGLASSTPKERMLKTLRNGLLTRMEGVTALEEVFSAILSRSDVVNPKPAPEAYLLAAQRLGVATEECVVFEDSEVGVRAGKAAGMLVFAVPNFYTSHQDHSAADVKLGSLTEVLTEGYL
jgi:HAD superfamily hydrolase (TIGR01509 family)